MAKKTAHEHTLVSHSQYCLHDFYFSVTSILLYIIKLFKMNKIWAGASSPTIHIPLFLNLMRDFFWPTWQLNYSLVFQDSIFLPPISFEHPHCEAQCCPEDSSLPYWCETTSPHLSFLFCIFLPLLWFQCSALKLSLLFHPSLSLLTLYSFSLHCSLLLLVGVFFGSFLFPQTSNEVFFFFYTLFLLIMITDI